jgi:hypothetical protein
MTATAYLDTNLVSGLVKEDLGAELDALRVILRARKQGSIDVRTSMVTAEELAKVRADARARHEDIYALLEDVPATAERFGSDIMLMGVGGLHEDERLTRLKQILPHEADARHLFQAISNDVTYFVTADRRSILRYASELHEAFGIAVRAPSELVTELDLSWS